MEDTEIMMTEAVQEELPEDAKECSKPNLWEDNRGVGVIEIVLILVKIFTMNRHVFYVYTFSF